MSGLQYMGGMNNYMFDVSQYGVSTPNDSFQSNQQMSSLISMIPYVGPILGAVANIAGTAYQNNKQEEFFNKYMSPAARMAQMRAAGINPNAAAQGISGAPASQMNAATPSGAFTGLGEQLGNSFNTYLTAQAIKAGIDNTNANTDLTNSLNTEKTITNSYLDRYQLAALNKLVADGEMSRSFANMAKVDEAYKPQAAFASTQQLFANLNRVAAEIDSLNASVIKQYAQAYQSFMAGNLSEAQIHKVFSDIGLNDAMIKKIGYEIDVLEATETSIYQDITESQARTTALNIRNKFQNDYYEIWQNTGFNWTSEIEKSIVGAYQNFDIKTGDRISHSLQKYLVAVDESQAQSDKYWTDFSMGIVNSCIGALGLGAAASIHANAYSRTPKSHTTTTFESGGVKYQTTRYGDVEPFSGRVVSKRSRPIVKP